MIDSSVPHWPAPSTLTEPGFTPRDSALRATARGVPPGAIAQHVATAIDDDAPEPGVELAPIPKSFPAFPSADERVLHRVLRCDAIAEDGVGKAERLAQVGVDERAALLDEAHGILSRLDLPLLAERVRRTTV